MKGHRSCLGRIFSLIFFSGILFAALLGYTGYEKANEAEADRTPINQLYTVYAGNAPNLAAESDLFDAMLNGITGDNELLKKLSAGLGDKTTAKAITKAYYLPDDETITTAIGQRILMHRLKKTYTQKELLAIYCGIQGYDMTGLSGEGNLLQKGEIQDPETLKNKAAPFLSHLIQDLQNQGILNEENATEIQNLLN